MKIVAAEWSPCVKVFSEPSAARGIKQSPRAGEIEPNEMVACEHCFFVVITDLRHAKIGA